MFVIRDRRDFYSGQTSFEMAGEHCESYKEGREHLGEGEIAWILLSLAEQAILKLDARVKDLETKVSKLTHEVEET